ncbi:bifunctional transcriptional activator/DNA repair enzyme AdaA [Alkalihalobacillus sp. AL-G]|uniref:bifunctional transcriptional activator/DNA repair enzyme AdaA n=1 Tax=Alkalihalobacillus sp. AL-G TaxID=2926399 RepID=UPI00272C1DD3|nr:Ada metal-binding domain-containing protein [Alkalihalobacillus sp. AL-G]WLD92832.1 AraC family transcriptional regulator [Alkalihalobacillus sp. AL-G]
MSDDAIFQSVYETILQRNTRYDGVYYVGIKSTGIFCRPSCRSRIPKPENVMVYRSIEAAREAGFRPCKRCKPDSPEQHGPDAKMANIVIELIQERYDENLTLDLLAEELKMSPYHLQRVFKRTTGMTPSNQLLRTRMEKAEQFLDQMDYSIAEIAAMVGFRSASHFSSVFKKEKGYTPNEYRKVHKKEV